jgi:hypothetical protein
MSDSRARASAASFGGVPVALFLLGCLAACSDAAAGPSERLATGTLTGRVRLMAGAALPAYAPFDLVRRPLHERAQREPPSACAEALDSARRPVAMTPEGMLSGVVVAASDFARYRARPPMTHEIALRGCRLEPAAITATRGDHVAVRNLDDFSFGLLVGPSRRARTLARGERLREPLVPGVDAVMCDRVAPCGRTDLVVFQHAVHGVTGAEGAFRIDEFPAAELVRVTAWHPLFEESETFVWVEPGKASNVELVLSPKPRFVVEPSANAQDRAAPPP